jgi:hypothetical protein
VVAPIRVLIPGDSQEPEVLGLALAYAQEIAKKSEARDVILVTHTKGQLSDTGLASNLGAKVTKALLSGREVSLNTGAKLRHGTTATLRYHSGRSVIIAYYADDKLLDFVDGMTEVKGVVAVPWVPGQVDQWLERWTPIVHGKEKQAPAAILDDPVVEAALQSVSNIINHSHSLLQSRDKEWVDDALRILRAKGHLLDEMKIRNWAIRNGWKPGAADDLAKLVRKIAGMTTRPRLTSIHNPDGRYARWKSGEL